MLMMRREGHGADQRDGVSRPETQANAGDLGLKAMRTGIGAELKTLYSEVFREGVPYAMADLLRQLDQQTNAGSAQRP